MSETQDRESSSAALRKFTGRQVAILQNGYLADKPAARAKLAQLRRQNPAKDDGVLEIMSIGFDDPPPQMVGTKDVPSPGEVACAAALSLYAGHQQSKKEPMHRQGEGLGRAIRKLANPSDAESREKPVMRRFQALNTATDMPEILHHLRGLVAQLRDEGIPLDYALLANDLYLLPNPKYRTSVRLRWARDLTRPLKKDKTEAGGATSAPAVSTPDA